VDASGDGSYEMKPKSALSFSSGTIRRMNVPNPSRLSAAQTANFVGLKDDIVFTPMCLPSIA
jgi:hypothetical protein